ncbi:DUF1007 family protein [Paenalcaligenes sp. Me131]|uniref:DUF1007 family protein n=1 Tax=Paenalcaligenes sp. Me131 TaxID=3392636 RepID=UPI003D2C1B0F
MSMLPFAVQSHPHAWIYVETSFLMSADGYVTAIEQHWNYDNLLTDVLLDDLMREAAGEALDMDKWAQETLNKLEPLNYFLRVQSGETTLALGDILQFSGELLDDELHLRFTVLLKQPMKMAGADMALAVFDPSFYIEILQHPERPPRIQGDSARECELRLQYPEPTTEDFLMAAAIDNGLEVGPQFGALFAETVHVHCE